MALVHDDDLILLDRLGDDTVGGCLYFSPIVSIFSCLQSLEALRPDTVLRHLRCLEPEVHDVTFGPGELLPVPNFSIPHNSGTHTKDPSSCGKGANTDAETFRVATLSMTFGGRCEFYILRRLLLDCIASDSSIAGIICISSKSRLRQ